MPTEAFRLWANRKNAKRRVGVIIYLPRISDEMVMPLRVADSGGEIDGLGNWRPCIATPASISQTMQELMTGNSLVSHGNLKLALEDRAKLGQDGTLTWNQLATLYRWPGAAFRQVVGGDDLAWADWAAYFQGSLGIPTFSDANIDAPTYSRSRDLATTTVPAGTYGSSVPSSSKGKTIPLCLGKCLNITLILISDGGGSGPWVYQWMDPSIGPSQALDALYVDSVQVTSGFTTDLANSKVTFIAKPASTPTADVRGVVYNGVYLVKFGQMVKALLKIYRSLSDADLDLPTFAALDSSFPYELNKYLTSASDLKTLLDDLAGGLPVFWDDMGEGGTYRVGLFEAPTGSPELNIYDGTSQDPQHGSAWGWEFTKTQAKTWYSSITLKGARNYTTQTPSNSSLSADRLGWLAEEYRSATVTTSAPADNPEVTTAEWTTNITYVADLTTVANMQAALHGVPRDLVKFQSLAAAMTLKAAKVCQVFRSRWGMDSGWLGRVISIDMSTPVLGQVTLWG